MKKGKNFKTTEGRCPTDSLEEQGVCCIRAFPFLRERTSFSSSNGKERIYGRAFARLPWPCTPRFLFSLFILFILVFSFVLGCDDGGGSSDPKLGIIEMVEIPAVTAWPVGSGTVTLSAFAMGKYEVTQEQWATVMTGSANNANPSSFTSGADGTEIQAKRPVENVTWFDAIEFCNILSTKEGLTPYYTITGITRDASGSITAAAVTTASGNGYRLPTEVQWQYAAQAGSTSQVTVTESTGWYYDNSNSKTHQVGLKTPNAFGLYDMLGNVREWCWDWYGSTYPNPNGGTNPAGASTGSSRVMRGGGWNGTAAYMRSAVRGITDPYNRDNTIGFRVVR